MFEQVTVIDTIYNGNELPQTVHEDIDQLWTDYELGNDDYYKRIDEDYMSEFDDVYPNLIGFLREKGIKECLIRKWW